MLTLPSREAHLWYLLPQEASDPALRSRYEILMTPEEKARRDRFLFDKGQQEFLLTRALVRTVLSRYAPVPPAAWRFVAQERGKPEVDTPAEHRWLRFNLSHTDGLIACVVTRERAVGVDVEHTERASATDDIAERFFAPAEVAALRALPVSARRRRFFEYWTLKESYIKARGMGLALPLDQFAFTLGPGRHIGIDFGPRIADEPTAWQFHLWRPTHLNQGAVTIEKGVGPRLRLRIRKTVPLGQCYDAHEEGEP